MESFSSWYYRVVVGDGFKIWQSLVILTFDTFSIPLLARTLLYPWRRDVVGPTEPGLNLIFQALVFNFVSRLIGLTIRINTILVGLILTALMAVVGGGAVLALTLLPTIVFLGLITALIFLTNKVLFGLGLLIGGGAVAGLAIAYTYWRQVARLNPPLPQPLEVVITKLHQGDRLNLEAYVEGHLAQMILASRSLADLARRLIHEPDVRFILTHLALPADAVTRLAIPANLTLRLVMAEAAELAEAAGLARITAAAGLVALIKKNPAAGPTLDRFKLKIDDLVAVANWYHRLYKLSHPPSPLLDPANLKTSGGIGRDWAYGYTPLLDRFTHELTGQLTRSFGDHYLAHRTEIDQVERVLARSGKHNVLLLGEPGVGKRTVMLGLTWRIHGGQTLRPLRHKRVLELDISAVLAGATVTGELEARLVDLLNQAARAGNVILFIDRLERLFGASAGEAGVVNAGQILLPYLESSALQLVGATTLADYHRFFERLPSVTAQLERVEVHEPSTDQVRLILEEIAPLFETRHGIIISYQAIKEVVEVSERYLTNRKFPEKAIDLLDEATVHLASSRHEPFLLPEHIDELVSQKTHVPIGQVRTEEKEQLLNLEDRLHERVVNQNEAIGAIAQALRRARSGVARTDRPIGTFLFLGPTGVGKTETAKTLAAIYFGSEKTLIRLDLNEYLETNAAHRLIGGPGFEAGGLLTNPVKERPFSTVLLDEIEKAHPNILNIFLQLLDEGRLQDGLGEVVNFTNTIIIGTSNAGSEFIRERLRPADQNLKPIDFKEQLLEYLQHNNIFRPELLNRFDAIVVFRLLTKEELVKVVELHLKRINRYLADKQMAIVMTPQAAVKLAEIGFDPQFGARALARAIQQKVENLIADKILRNELQAGGVLEITEAMIG